MTNTEIRLPPGELQRLAECILEPIRFPGTVQPHGVLIGVTADSHSITHLSDNTEELIGAPAINLFGHSLTELLGAAAVAEIMAVLEPSTSSANPVAVTVDGTQFDAITHRLGDVIVVELEPIDPAFVDENTLLRGAFRRLGGAQTVKELWDATATEVARITAFDRVMVYHFHPDEHGEIVAEVVAEGMEPYLGLHYPASDVPAQARELYLTKLSRMIASSDGVTAALLIDGNSESAATFDLSGAELRSVSPHHLDFMRNMGQASTFSLSLVGGHRLVGMITCAHRSKRRIPFRTRESLEILANQVALQLGALTEIERLERRNEIRDIRATLLAQVGGGDDIPAALLEHPMTLLTLIPADGAVISFGGRLHRIGTVPSDAEISSAVAELHTWRELEPFVSDAIPLDHPGLAAAIPRVAGIIFQRFGRDGEFIAWFRGEITHTVDWLGDMSPGNRRTPLSPRNSFSAWSEQVTGTSAPWAGMEREAGELTRDLETVLLRRAESALAELALRDPLTGLPNRRLLMDRLAQALERRPGPGGVAVLFIDLDGFKKINDTLGHAVGDDALMFVAGRLLECARATDTVARLGGDEFVVMCEQVTRAQSDDIANRVLAALARPDASHPSWNVGASIGIAIAEPGMSASQLLTIADSEMYRVKSSRKGAGGSR